MKLSLSLSLAALVMWPAVAIAGIPETQNEPPAGKDVPYTPACWQLEARPGEAPGWNGWGPIINGDHQKWLGLPHDWDIHSVYQELEAWGLCVKDGAGVPWEPIPEPEPEPLEESTAAPGAADEPVEGDEPKEELTPLERNHQRLTQGGDEPEGDGVVGLAVVAVILGAAWTMKDDGPEVEAAPRRPQVLSQDELIQVVQPLPVATPEPIHQPAPEPVAVPAMAPAPPMAPAPRQPSPVQSPGAAIAPPLDFSEVLASRVRPTLITSNPRKGKGMVVAYGWRRAKVQHGASVWLIQPKYVPQEFGYWEGVDQCFGFMAEDYLSATQKKKDELCGEIIQFIHAWRKESHRPSILIFDELSLMKAVFKSWYEAHLVPQILTEMSSGETDRRAFWGITQSPLSKDIGLSGGNRAPFDLLVLEAKEDNEHLQSICRSYAGVPAPGDEAIYERSYSPKKTIAYHSAVGDWHPMFAYQELRSQGSGFMNVHAGSPPEPIDMGEGSQVQVQVQGSGSPSEPAPLMPGEPEPQIVDRVLSLKSEGLTQDQIIEAVWGAKKGGSHAYKEARSLYQFIIETYGD